MEAARVLSQHLLRSTVVFIGFDREEQWMKGSSAYVSAHAGDDVRGMISLDMIAFNDPNLRNTAFIYGRTASDQIKQALAGAVSQYSGGLSASVGGDLPYSDHAPFETAGKQACVLIEHYSGNGNYHRTSDNVDTPNYIDYAYATKMTRSTVGYLATAAGLVPEWTTSGWGNWSAASNWSSAVPNGADEWAVFGDHVSGSTCTVTVNTPVSLGTVKLDNGATSYNIAGGGGTLTMLSNGGRNSVINAASGTHTISAPLAIPAGKAVDRTGAGTLTISGTQSHGAGATFNALGGTTDFQADAGWRALSVNLGDGSAAARVNFGVTQHLASLTISPSALVTITEGPITRTVLDTTLTIAGQEDAWTGKLDLNNNAMIVRYPDAGDHGQGKLAEVINQITTGLHNGPLGYWDGPGICSSAARDDPMLITGLGAIRNDLGQGGAWYTEFAGQSVDRNTILVRYTYYGDNNLDGRVDLDNDFPLFVDGFSAFPPGPDLWLMGDYNYDGRIDLDNDFSLFVSGYNNQGNPLSAMQVAAMRAELLGSVAVPEPAVLWLLAAGVVATLTRHRRRP
jgi:hypothetical protein